MNEVKLSQANQVYLNKKRNANAVTTSPVKQDKQIEGGNKKIKLALAGLAGIGMAITAGFAICKHKNVSQVLDKGKEEAVKILNGLDVKARRELFENIKTDKFTGIVQDTLKNGDKVVLEYTDGILKKSSKSGADAFEKLYETLENGTHKVTMTKDGKSTSVIIEDLQNAAKDSQKKLQELLAKKDALTPEEFQKQTDKIKHTTKGQKEEIQNIIKDKQKVPKKEKAAKEEAKRLAKEIQDSSDEIPELLKGNGLKEACPEEYTIIESKKIKELDDSDIEEFMLLKDYTYENNINEALSGRNRLDKFYMMAQNAAERNGSATYIDEIPKMFEGIDQKTLAIDIDKAILNGSINSNTILIGGKKFNIEKIGAGTYSAVYKISDGINKPLALKTSISQNQSTYLNEILLAKQLKDANIVDVPRFYAGNPITERYHNPKKFGLVDRAAWMLSDCVSPDDIVPKDGLKLFDYLKSNGGQHYDLNKGTFVGDFIVDLGGIRGKNLPEYYSSFINTFSWFIQDNGYSISDFSKLISEIHK